MAKTSRREPRAHSTKPEAELARKLIYDSAVWDSDAEGEPAQGEPQGPALPPKDERQLVECVARLASMKDPRGGWPPIFDDGENFGLWDKLNEALDLAGFIVGQTDDGGYAIECGNAVVRLRRAQFEATVLEIRSIVR